jgi:nicotinamidase/pyrazinamidase
MLINKTPSAEYFFNPKTTAVIVVDVQHDFTEARNGALAVQGANDFYLQKVTEASNLFGEAGYFVVATQDYHPSQHISFATTHNMEPFQTLVIQNRPQMLWPDHCVQMSEGSEILIPKEYLHYIQQKGMSPEVDSYSGFLDEGHTHTGLHDVLSSKGIQTLIVYGLATDYCVKATAIDGVILGYQVYVINNLSRGVAEESSASAKKELQDKGVILVESLADLNF